MFCRSSKAKALVCQICNLGRPSMSPHFVHSIMTVISECTEVSYTQDNILGLVSCCGKFVMVWGDISLEARTELVIVQGGGQTTIRFITAILKSHVVPFVPFIGSFLLIQCNARPHIAKVVNNHFQDVEVPTLWSVTSLTLNPNEYLWDIVIGLYKYL